MVLHSSGEDYLKAIFVLQKDKGKVRSIDVAAFMGVSKPSVSHAVKLLREGGFLTKESNHFLHLTDLGREVAEKLYARHQYFTEQLTGAGVDATVAKEEACKMEHTLSHESFQLLKEQKQNTCPFADSCQLVTESKSSTKEDN